ncbi:MAG: hypothetical protein PHV39_04465 [Methanomicrobium sp.]|nr:hypothetical protein [Methanomicrobium sp.]
MKINRQPLRGLIPAVFVIIVSIISIYAGELIFGLDAAMLSVYALFFVWTAFLISLCDRWPFEKLSQPASGLAFLMIALIIGIFHPIIIQLLGFPSTLFWPLISNLFLGVGIIIAFGNKLVEGFAQPASIGLNTLFCYTLAILIIQIFGMVPSIWFAIFVFVIFWLDFWPVKEASQPAKGILTFVLIGALTLILEYSFIIADTDFFNPDASLWFVLFVWWLVLSSWQFETWPFVKFVQPEKAILGLIISVILTFTSYYMIVLVLRFEPGIASGYVWVFVAWLYTWDIVFGKWPAEQSTNADNSEAPVTKLTD